MGFLFDTGLNQEFKYDSNYQYSTSNQTSNTSNYSNQTTNDIVYNPIFNINSANSDISPTTKKELNTTQNTPTTTNPSQSSGQTTAKLDSSGSGIFTTSNLLIFGLIGLGAYFLMKK